MDLTFTEYNPISTALCSITHAIPANSVERPPPNMSTPSKGTGSPAGTLSCSITYTGTSLRSNIFRKPVWVLKEGDTLFLDDDGKPIVSDMLGRYLGISKQSNKTGHSSRSNNPEIEFVEHPEERTEDGSRLYTLQVPLLEREIRYRTDPSRGIEHASIRQGGREGASSDSLHTAHGQFFLSDTTAKSTKAIDPPSGNVGEGRSPTSMRITVLMTSSEGSPHSTSTPESLTKRLKRVIEAK